MSAGLGLLLLALARAAEGAAADEEVARAAEGAAADEEAARAAEGAAADEEATDEPGPRTPGAEVLVVGERLRRARRALDRQLRELGYEGERRGDRVVYRHPVPHKPKVIVTDEGSLLIRRRGLVFRRVDIGDLGGWDVPLELFLCVVAPTACVSAQGLFISPARLDRQKQIVVDAVRDEVEDLQEALADAAQAGRLEGLPARLDALFYEGVALDGEAILPTFAARRSALVAYWRSRACNPWGDEVRGIVEDYIRYEIQPSSHPFPPWEIAALEADPPCGGSVDLDGDGRPAAGDGAAAAP